MDYITHFDSVTAGVSSGVLVALGILYNVIRAKYKKSGVEEIESFAKYSLNGLKYYLGRYLRRNIAAELTLRKFARDQLSNVGLDMLVPAAYPIKLNIDRVFVPLLLQDAGRGTFEFDAFLDGSAARFCVLGEPGSGKSSMMKRLFRDACRQAASSPRASRLPVLYELKRISVELKERAGRLSGNELLEQALEPFMASATYEPHKAYETLTSGQGILLLFDGLDEVPATDTQAVIEALIDLSRTLSVKSPGSTVVITSRSQHYFALQDRALAESFDVLTIGAFTQSDIYQFLTRWPFQANRMSEIARINSRIARYPSLLEMCTNPLALAMYVARDQQTDGAEPPETRTRFYQAFINELMVNRRFRREQEPSGRLRLQEARQRLLGQIALSHMLCFEEAANSVPLSRCLKAVDSSSFLTHSPLDTLQALAIDTGLFGIEREGESVRFLHLTVCEYLAAAELTEQGEGGWVSFFTVIQSVCSNLNSQVMIARLAETIAFCVGLAPRVLRRRMLEDLQSLGLRAIILKSLLESQAYDLELSGTAILDECGILRQEVESGLTEEFIARLRGLIAALRDVEVGARPEFLAPIEIPSPSDFLLRLINDRSDREALVSLLVRQDVEAAIHLAERSQDPKIYLAVAASASDATVLESVLLRRPESRFWSVALIESCLGSRRVAHQVWRRRVEHDSGTQRGGGKWSGSWFFKDRVYGQILDEALSVQEWPMCRFEAVRQEIVDLPPPSIRKAPTPWTVIQALLAFGAVLYSIKIVSAQAFDPVAFLAILGLTVAASFLGVAAQFVSTRLRTILRLNGAFRRLLPMPPLSQRISRREVPVGSPEASSFPDFASLTLPAGLSLDLVLQEIFNLSSYRFYGLDTHHSGILSIDHAAYYFRNRCVRVSRKQLSVLAGVRDLRRESNAARHEVRALSEDPSVLN